MPLLNASPATGRGGVLSDEDRMPSHGCLFAVIFGEIRGNSGIYKLKCVFLDGFETFGANVISIFWG
jgi:hypothetical protein